MRFYSYVIGSNGIVYYNFFLRTGVILLQLLGVLEEVTEGSWPGAEPQSEAPHLPTQVPLPTAPTAKAVCLQGWVMRYGDHLDVHWQHSSGL